VCALGLQRKRRHHDDKKCDHDRHISQTPSGLTGSAKFQPRALSPRGATIFARNAASVQSRIMDLVHLRSRHDRSKIVGFAF
jgi:hypothetical protein